MTRICLDTSAYSHFKRGEPRVVEMVDRAEWIGVPSVVVGELWAGFLRGARVEENVAELDDFLDHAVVETLCVDDGVARVYGEMVFDLRRRGQPLPTNDIWIAAHAMETGTELISSDGHFKDVDGLAWVHVSVE